MLYIKQGYNVMPADCVYIDGDATSISDDMGCEIATFQTHDIKSISDDFLNILKEGYLNLDDYSLEKKPINSAIRIGNIMLDIDYVVRYYSKHKEDECLQVLTKTKRFSDGLETTLEITISDIHDRHPHGVNMLAIMEDGLKMLIGDKA